MRDQSLWTTDSELADTRPSRRHHRPEEGVEHAVLEALLEHARTARDGDEALEYVQRAANLRPDDPRVLSTAQLSVFNKLRSDAFLAFLAETDKHYVIQFRNSRPYSVPKAHAIAEPYPPTHRRTEAERALRMMWWMILGLIPAGLGAVILSPVALWHGLRALQSDGRDLQQRRMAWVAILVALVLGMLGALFGALLVLHVLIG
jgi:hypothetical protein